MGQIRKQTILSSIVIYIGFIIGFINTYLYIKYGTFTSEQYGLTRLINDLGITLFSFATFGVITYIYKFYPYYKQNLSDKENDQVAFSFIIVLCGFLIVAAAAIILKPLFIRKFSERSRMLIDYYYWILPFTFGILFFTVFEAFAWFAQKSILTNFLRETLFRLLQTCLIFLFLFKIISFDFFIKLFSCLYIVLASILVFLLYQKGFIRFNFKVSRVTTRYSKKILTFTTLIYGGLIINTISQYIGAIVIASVSKNGLADVAVYSFAAFVASTIMVPQKSIVAATVPILSLSWKNRDLKEIERIYLRTSINLLLLGLFIFFIIWLNMHDLFRLLNINRDYEAGKFVILLLGMKAIIDAGTGVNSQIIGTSNFWRFEVFTGVLLFLLAIPLNYILIRKMGINGSALSDLLAYLIYNLVRLFFIWKKFAIQPFSLKTIYSIVLSLFLYFLTYYFFDSLHSWPGVILRTLFFAFGFIGAAYAFKLTPDIEQLYSLFLFKIRKKKNNVISE